MGCTLSPVTDVDPPTELAAGTHNPAVRYRIAPELVAVRNSGGTTSAVPAGPPGGPVYRRVPGGEPVVPTGRVLVRFSPDQQAEARGADLATVGYEIDEVLSYAPSAAWVRSADGDVAGALASLDRLAALPDVENVEPQMIGTSAPRS